MPVLGGLTGRFERERPLAGIRVSACLHVTTETANLVRMLRLPARRYGCARAIRCRRRTTSQPRWWRLDVPTFAVCGEGSDEYYRHIGEALAHGPQLTLDDGADLINTCTPRPDLLPAVIGGMEETTTG